MRSVLLLALVLAGCLAGGPAVDANDAAITLAAAQRAALAEADARFEDVEEYVALAVQAGEVLSTPTASRQDFHITHE
jgi:hypothetical protein